MADTSIHLYAIALGSNRAVAARRGPAQLLQEALTRIAVHGDVLAVAPIIVTAPLGPSSRRFANSAALVKTSLPPQAMLAFLQSVETSLGRRRYRRWGARSMDIDIILWSGGLWRSRSLIIPHPAFANRDFVLSPLTAIATDWRPPRLGCAIRHLNARFIKTKRTARG